MTKLSNLSLSFFISFLFFHQNINAQCIGEASEFLWVNEIGTDILNGGDLFWNRSDGKFLAPFVPGGIPTSTIFANGLWLGGFDSGGELKVACQQYGNANGLTDFWPGPIDESTEEVFPNGCDDFDYIWSVNRGEVLQIINDFADNGTLDLPIPEAIKKWPARGNPHFEAVMGFPLPDQDLAPFHDENGDNIYDPLNGDHPVLDPLTPNVIPDKLTWTVYNDIQGIHGETNSEPVGVEVQQMAYAFNSADDEVLNQTVFVKYIIHKKTAGDLEDFRTGSWIDFDLGCYSDDFIGCDTILNTQYVYNKDNDDNSPFCTTVGTYGENPPVQTATILNHKMTSFTYINNSGLATPPIPTLDPDNAMEFYFFLSSRWKDGTPLTYGGNGYNPASTDYVSHAFFDNPNDPNGWSMMNIIDFNFDQRGVMSIGPYDLPSGESITVDMAYTYHRGEGLDHLENVDFALGNIASLQGVFDNSFNNGNLNQFDFCTNDCVWPGDANRDGIAREDDLLFYGIALGNMASGPAAEPSTNMWAGRSRDDWGQAFFNGVEYKNADFFGDGTLDDTDLFVLDQNFGKTNSAYVPNDIPAPEVGGEIRLDWNKDEVSTTGIPVQRFITGEITLASAGLPFSEPLSGISFTVEYDPNLLENSLLPSIEMPNNSFLGADDELVFITHSDLEEGRLSIGISRKDGVALGPSFGDVAKVNLAIREDATTTNTSGTDTISVNFINIWGVNTDDELIPLGATSGTFIGTDMVVVDDTTSVGEIFDPNFSLSISPNPSSGHFSIFRQSDFQKLSLSIYGINGQKIWNGEMPSGQDRFDLNLDDNLQSGIYLLKAVREDGRFTTQKLLVE